jgi:hypothetical protein
MIYRPARNVFHRPTPRPKPETLSTNLDASPDAVRKTPFEFTSRWLAYSERTNTGDVTVEAAIDAAGARTQSGETEQL